jgi:GDP-L-fucose synthase
MPMQNKSTFFPPSGAWKGKRVLVTGGAGFLGRHLTERLIAFGAEVIVPRRKDYNFINMDLALKCLSTFRPEVVIHSAAYYGGLGITMAEPGRIYYENLVMGANLMEASRLNGVKKFVSVGTACSYPGHLENSLKESDLWAGPLHDSVLGYGSVKKMLAIQGIVYKRQYQFNSIHLIPSNLYGPFDCFDDYRSHVVGALLRRFCEAHREGKDVTVWGSGKAIREFLFVEDCADGILLAAENYNDTVPLNIGTGVGTSIRELVQAITEALHFKGEVLWDRTKPDGQPVKILDTTYMKAQLGWTPRTFLKDGIRKTIEWFGRANYGEALLPKTIDGEPLPDLESPKAIAL